MYHCCSWGCIHFSFHMQMRFTVIPLYNFWLHPAIPKPRCCEHILQLIVTAGFPSFSKTLLFWKGYWGNPSILKPPHSKLTLTLTHFRNVRVRLEVGISAPRIAVFNFGTAVFWGEGRNSGVSEWGVSEWRGVAMEVCRNWRLSPQYFYVFICSVCCIH